MRHPTRPWAIFAALAVATSLVALTPAGVRGDQPPAYEALSTRLLQTGLREQGAYATLKKLLSVGPRLTGSAQAEAAVKLMADHMTALGFDRVRTEPTVVCHWVRGAVEEGRILSKTAGTIPLKVRALGSSVATPAAGLTAGIVEVHSIAELETIGDKARGKIVFHTSGAVTSAALAPLGAAGAACASFHPVQTFPRKDLAPSVFQGATIDLEGDPRAVRAGAVLARKLGARPLVLRAEDKALFHAAEGIASNLFIPLFDTACRLLASTGIADRDAAAILLPLAEGTLQSVKRLDRSTALTGPISRGDVETVRRHISVLRKHPAALRIYKVLGTEAMALAKRGNRIPPARVRAMARLLAGK